MSTTHLLETAEIRRLRPHEAGDVVDGVFAGMSDESRRLRFHLPITRLPAYFRQELIRVDTRSRAAVAAWDGDRPVGVGRIAALSETEAEVAVAVIDAWHGRGLGRRLLTAAADLAAVLGYHQLVADVLAENTAMLTVLARVFPGSRRERDGHVVRVIVDLTASHVVREPAFAAAS